MGLDARNPEFSVACEQQRHRPACVSTHSDQLPCFHSQKFKVFKLLASKSFVFYLVYAHEQTDFSLKCYCKCSVDLPHSAVGWYAVCGCGIS